MRIFTLLSFAAIFAAQSANAQNPVQNQRISLESVSGVYAPAQSPVAKKAVSDIMRPAKEQIFYRNDKDDGWAEKAAEEYTYTYDEKGRVNLSHKDAMRGDRRQGSQRRAGQVNRLSIPKRQTGRALRPPRLFRFLRHNKRPGFPAKPKRIFSLFPQGASSHYGGKGEGVFWRKAPSPLDPHPKHGGRHLTPSRRYDSCPNGRQSCRFLESTSLYPPPAALWCFPLWKSFPRKDGGATVEREAEDVLFATPVCEGLSGAGTH